MGKKSKEKKEKKKKKEKRRKHSSSSSESDSCEWVEKKVELATNEKLETITKIEEREEWMNMSNIFSCTSRDELRKAKEAEKQQEKSSVMIQAPGQSDRETNPYWKNGGTGLPEENKPNSTMADVYWLKKSLKRAEEHAISEGKSLEEVAAERWGSLDTIKQMIREAEIRTSNNDHIRNYNKNSFEKYERKNKYNNYHRDEYKEKRKRSRSKSRERHRSSSKDEYNNKKSVFRKPKDDYDNEYEKSREKYSSERKSSYNDNYKSKSSTFKKPNIDTDFCRNSDKSSSSRSSRNWQKPEFRKSEEEIRRPDEKHSPRRESETISTQEPETNVILNEEEMNLLGAKIVKAEIMGKTELANQLKLKLENARASRQQTSKNESIVLLTKTDNKGNTRLLNLRGNLSESNDKRKKKRVETHEKQERVRYFADDDKYSLQQMFQHEKGRSTVDDDAVFTKLMSKRTDMDEIFEEQISKESTGSKQHARDRMRAIKEHQSMTRSLDNCYLCVDSNRMMKHTIVTTGAKIYLSLPATNPLVTGHCILSTITHIPCQTQLDEDYWEELKEFKTKLTTIFSKKDKEPVFVETFLKRNKFPHIKVECIPLPKDEAAMAPIYFKKALLECETEWAVNKKVVEFKNLQKSIPKGLPYFAVEFGTDGGFAHVIEDEALFSYNFANEVIGGMLDVDATLWRKPKKLEIEELLENINDFQKEWNI